MVRRIKVVVPGMMMMIVLNGNTPPLKIFPDQQRIITSSVNEQTYPEYSPD